MLFALVFAGPPTSYVGLMFALVTLPVALTINILAQQAVAAAAFWVRDAKAAWFLYGKFVFILGGLLLPIEVLPDAL